MRRVPFLFFGGIGLKFALVTTAKGLNPAFFTFLRHHRDVGFSRVYLFVDDPEYDLAFVEGLLRSDFNDFVRVIPHDSRLKEIHSKTDYFKLHEATYARRVVTRQQLNVGYSVALALEEGIDWLCHLDTDELFGLRPGVDSVREYLSGFGTDVAEVFVPNVEAVPQEVEIQDPFLEISWFKKTPFICSEKQWVYMEHRSFRRFPFVGYAHGKSIFRPRAFSDIEVPTTVHHYHPNLASDVVWIDDSLRALILHYPLCGFEAFRARVGGFNLNRINQYEESGDGVKPIGAILEARDLVRAGQEERLLEYYREEVAYFNPVELETMKGLGLLMDAGGYCRVKKARRI